MPASTSNQLPKTRIRRWGNSIAVRLPRTILAKAHLAEGATVKIQSTTKGILLIAQTSAKPKRKYTLRQLCKGMTPAKSHPEFEWGGPVGAELI